MITVTPSRSFLTLFDFDGDGAIDVTANMNRGHLLVVLNRKNERGHGHLCDRDPEWNLSRRVGFVNGLNLQLASVGPLFGHENVPTVVRVGDNSSDGKPDFIVTTCIPVPVTFENDCGCAKKDKGLKPHFMDIPENAVLAKATGTRHAITRFSSIVRKPAGKTSWSRHRRTERPT